MRPILVTGAAGRVGRCVVHRLAAERKAVRMLVHRGNSHIASPSHESVQGDFNDPELMRRICSGVQIVFTYVPRIDACDAVFRAMHEAGVRQVVVLSSASVTKAPLGINPIAERHRAAEAAVRRLGMRWTFIRPDTMASNCLQWADDIRWKGRVYGAYPESMRNPVHEDDLAQLAVQALLSEALCGRALYVTGPEILSMRQQVQIISDAVARPLEWVQVSEQEAMDRMLRADPKMSLVAVQRLLDYMRKTQTEVPQISADFHDVMGVPPKSFRQWVHDNLDAF